MIAKIRNAIHLGEESTVSQILQTVGSGAGTGGGTAGTGGKPPGSSLDVLLESKLDMEGNKALHLACVNGKLAFILSQIFCRQ